MALLFFIGPHIDGGRSVTIAVSHAPVAVHVSGRDELEAGFQRVVIDIVVAFIDAGRSQSESQVAPRFIDEPRFGVRRCCLP